MSWRVAIVGCGDMGERHAAAWGARRDARVVAVHDVDGGRAARLAARTGARPCTELEEALAAVDVVSVCVPAAEHAAIACRAANLGRHVLCEKPIALTLADADRMITAARDAGVLLAVSFQYRGFPKNLAYRSLFASGAFGGPVFARYSDVREIRPKLAMHRRSGNGGPVVDMAGHFFDLVRFVTGHDPVRVFARGHVFGKQTQRLAAVDDLAIDAAEVLVEYSDGHVLSVFVDWGMPAGHPGGAQESWTGPALTARPVAESLEVQYAGRREIVALGPAPIGPEVRVADLVAAIESHAPLSVTGEDGRTALVVSLAALESIATGRAVELARPAAGAGRPKPSGGQRT